MITVASERELATLASLLKNTRLNAGDIEWLRLQVTSPRSVPATWICAWLRMGAP